MYLGPTHAAAILALDRSLGLEPVVDTGPGLGLAGVEPDDLIRRLKTGVGQYNSGTVTISLERVPTSSVQLMVRRIRPYKLTQIHFLRQMYEQAELPLFGTAMFECLGFSPSCVTPPVVEIWGDQAVVIEGNTRFLYAARNGITELTALVVRNVSAPLPGEPAPISDVTLAANDDSHEDRIAGFNYRLFRHIERAARPLPTP